MAKYAHLTNKCQYPLNFHIRTVYPENFLNVWKSVCRLFVKISEYKVEIGPSKNENDVVVAS